MIDSFTNDFVSFDALEEELKFISVFSISNRIPFDVILKMPRSRFDFIVKSISDYNKEQEREQSLKKNIGSGGGLLG